MDAARQRCDLDALEAPLVGAAHTEQRPQRGERGPVGGTKGFRTGLSHVRRAPQGYPVLGIQRHEQRAQRPRALCPGLSIQMEGLCRRCRRRGGRRFVAPSRPAVGASGQCHQHLARILEVPPPQQRGPLAGKPVGLLSAGAVIRDDHARGGRRSAFRAPARTTRLPCFRPTDERGWWRSRVRCRAAHAGPQCTSQITKPARRQAA